MLCTWIGEMTNPKLMDTAKPLKLRTVNDIEQPFIMPSIYVYIIIERIAKYLVAHAIPLVQ